MEIKIKNQFLNSTLIQLDKLMIEKVSIGVKNRLTKAIRVIQPDAKAYGESHVELIKKHGGTENEDKSWSIKGEIPTDYFIEFKELSELENTYTLDQIDYKKIAEIETEFPYDFTEVKGLFENYED